VTITTTLLADFQLISEKIFPMKTPKKVQYQWPIGVTKAEKTMMVYLLLDQVERQRWYSVVYTNLWRTVGLVCTQ
jgi:hypothetical protein